ncbi:hypothetical protein K0M31_013899, partial [Melipona bicolor]
ETSEAKKSITLEASRALYTRGLFVPSRLRTPEVVSFIVEWCVTRENASPKKNWATRSEKKWTEPGRKREEGLVKMKKDTER